MFRVFIEGYEQKVSRISVTTGIGPLTAIIVLPPGENRRRIMPGSRVYAFLKRPEGWVAWFQGVTMNTPETTIGFDENEVTLSISGDIGLLQSVSMNYISIGNQNVQNQTFKSMPFAGRVNLFRGGMGPLLFPFASISSDRNINFGNRVVGMIQGLVSMDPYGWEDLRRLQYLSRLAVMMADDVAQMLDSVVLAQAMCYVLGSIQSPQFHALDILNAIMQMSLHELVSIAPLRWAEKIPILDRGFFYLSPEMKISSLGAMNQNEIVSSMCKMTKQDAMIDHYIKPTGRFHAPKENLITKAHYKNLYIMDQRVTRAIFRMPLFQTEKPVATIEEIVPESLNRVWQISQDLTKVGKNAPELGCVSNALRAKLNGIRTNREKIMGNVSFANIPLDARITNMVNTIGHIKGEEGAAKYVESYLNYEFEKMQGVGITIQDAIFNPSPIPGYSIKIEDSKGKWYTGKLVRKTDTIDLQSSHASSSYMIEGCRADEGNNYDAQIDPHGESIDSVFSKNTDVNPDACSPIFSSYDATVLSNSLKNYVKMPTFMVQNHVVIQKGEIKADRDGSDIVSENIPKTEKFYSYFDLLPLVAYETLVRRFGVTLEDNHLLPKLTKKEAVGVLDSKEGNIFSIGEALQGNPTIVTPEIKTIFREVAAIDPLHKELPKDEAEFTSFLLNSYIDKMSSYNYNYPIWEGNPCPIKLEILLYILSGIPKDQYQNFLKDGNTDSFDFSKTIPIPLSDREIITMRREIARKAKNE